MCGIIACLLKSNQHQSDRAFCILIEGLRVLQNRGYDSAGVASIASAPRVKAAINITRRASLSTHDAIDALQHHKLHHDAARVAIGHTRWATHGAKTERNAHPHCDVTNTVAVVHNGIINNYVEIRDRLSESDIIFSSDTDTEVIPQLFGSYLATGLSETVAFEETLGQLEGTWAIAMISTSTPDTLYVARRGSPLIIAETSDAVLVSSESAAVAHLTNHFYCLQDGEFMVIRKRHGQFVIVTDQNTTEPLSERTAAHLIPIGRQIIHPTPAPFQHWTEREIKLQPQTIIDVINRGGRLIGSTGVKLGGLDEQRHRLTDINHLIMLGCGTSLHAAMFGLPFLRQIGVFTTVQAFDAAEFVHADLPRTGIVGVCFLSQSGETRDCIRLLHNLPADTITIGIINVVGSLLARETDCGVYLNAGREVGVASTKSFTSQSVALLMVGMWFAQNRQRAQTLVHRTVTSIRGLSPLFRQVLGNHDDTLDALVDYLGDVDKTLFILGRGVSYPIALEGALKIKELAYMSVEAYPGGSMKHGPFALIEPGSPIILLILDGDRMSRMVSAAEEVTARGAAVFVITDRRGVAARLRLDERSIFFLPEKQQECISALLATLIFQRLAYSLAVARGHDPDFPRNLAKVVTVDG